MPFKIMVVEDETDFREVLVEFLRLKGYEAMGVESIHHYQNLEDLPSYDLMVLDRSLPDGDGLTILESHRKHSNIPVVILSGLGQLDERIKGLDADADHYLVKPVVMPELLAIIGRYARQANSGPGNSESFWSLNARQWTLNSPEGLTVKLTNSEFIFLNCFEGIDGKRVARDHIISSLGYRPEAYDVRRIESLISRLRNKVKDAGVDEFPLCTVYGGGYAFNASLVNQK